MGLSPSESSTSNQGFLLLANACNLTQCIPTSLHVLQAQRQALQGGQPGGLLPPPQQGQPQRPSAPPAPAAVAAAGNGGGGRGFDVAWGAGSSTAGPR